MTKLERAYREAVYRIRVSGRDVAFTFAGVPAGQWPAPPLPAGDWAIITAFNPGGRTLGPSENLLRNDTLRRELESRALPHTPSVASDTHGRHREEGYLITGAARGECLRLARTFEQLAVVFGHHARCGLLFTDPERWIELPAFMCAVPPEAPAA